MVPRILHPVAVAGAVASLLLTTGGAMAASHSDAPLISGDPFEIRGVTTDTYAFVAFNRDPKSAGGGTTLSLFDPFAPTLIMNEQDNSFLAYIGLGFDPIPMSFRGNTLPETFDSALSGLSLAVYPLGSTGSTSVFNVLITFMTDSGGIVAPGAETFFLVDPLLGGVDSAATFGMNFDFTSLSLASVTFRVFDGQGSPIAFQLASTLPEPAGLALFGLGLAGLALLRRRRAG